MSDSKFAQSGSVNQDPSRKLIKPLHKPDQVLPTLDRSHPSLPLHPGRTFFSQLRMTSFKIVALLTAFYFVLHFHDGLLTPYSTLKWSKRPPDYAARILLECNALEMVPGPPIGFADREVSDRYVPGTRATLLRNATIWTGGRNGTEVVYGDLFIDKGLIKAFGYIPMPLLNEVEEGQLDVVDVNGAWITPGLFDLHSHVGVMTTPVMRGSRDFTSSKGPIQPWDRILDGLNVHDSALSLSIAGGVTTSLILPSSRNAIGQSFVIKHRETSERSPSSKVVELPHHIDGSDYDISLPPRWRYFKHAVGEDPSTAYGQTRLDTMWQLREAYGKAKVEKEKQDAYCAAARKGMWGDIPEEIPRSMEWEALVDVLRGRTKVNVHCFTATDFDAVIRLSNEFKFPIAAFHHAHQAFFLTDLLKKTYGEPPAMALHAIQGGWKAEAYRGSEHAPKILADRGFKVVMKSDHPLVESRHLIYEAAQAHYYGLHPALALSSVTRVPAEVAGLGHRLGNIRENYDADLVIWDSHPLALGATPQQVYIDGIPQLKKPHVLNKPDTYQVIPRTPNFDDEAKKAIKYEGLVPLEPVSKVGSIGDNEAVVFVNVKSLWKRNEDTPMGVKDMLDDVSATGVVVVRQGKVEWAGSRAASLNAIGSISRAAKTIDLEGGSIAPGLTSFGSALGLEEMQAEPTTNDGPIDPSKLDFVVRAKDGLSLGGRHLLLAYRSGVTSAITAPVSSTHLGGLSTCFRTGAMSLLDEGSVVQDIVALHAIIGSHSWMEEMFSNNAGPSISTQVGMLRSLLLGKQATELGEWYQRAAKGQVPLVINVAKADHMATLIQLKREIESITLVKMRMVFGVATEAHLIADEIAAADIGVILLPPRPSPLVWDMKRALLGPPLSQETLVTKLLHSGVLVGLGTFETVTTRNARFDLAWTAMDANGSLSESDTMALASSNIDKMLGIRRSNGVAEDLVVYHGGGIFDMSSKVIGVISEERALVDLF